VAVKETTRARVRSPGNKSRRQLNAVAGAATTNVADVVVAETVVGMMTRTDTNAESSTWGCLECFRQNSCTIEATPLTLMNSTAKL
jgi:hypothetical protein